MTKPAAVVFDLGKVLVDFDYGIAANKIAPRSRATPDEVQRLLDHSPLLYRFETGLLTSQQFYEEVRAATGFTGAYEEFREMFAEIFSEIPAMISLQATLRSKGLPTYIFSNTNEIAVKYIRDTFPFFANFDGYLFSYREGVKKPEPEIYELMERMTGQRGGDIVYLDDRTDNIEGGDKRGWQTILHEMPARTIAALRAMGLPVSP